MTYSSARFTCAEQSLESAQSEKYDALCQKLQLTPNDRVLEIGCGWGGFALHAARNYDCHITGLTISPAQHQEAISRIKRAGLEDRIEIRMQDYRDLTGQFDKIVSIEMLEAVGDKFLETWCSKRRARGLHPPRKRCHPDSRRRIEFLILAFRCQTLITMTPNPVGLTSKPRQRRSPASGSED